MRNIWLIVFALVSAVNLAAVALEGKSLIFITKPLLMPLLAVWLATETRGLPARFLKKMMFAGLSFSTLGDVLLLWGEQPFFFMLGLVAFLCAHLSYISGFSSIVNQKNSFLRRQPGWALPFAVFLAGFLWWLWPGIPPEMRLPVSVYAGVITTMALSVVNLKSSIAQKTFWPMLVGALLFMLSDCLIAVHKFGGSFQGAGLAVMVTYIAGQFLIAKGVRDIVQK